MTSYNSSLRNNNCVGEHSTETLYLYYRASGIESGNCMVLTNWEKMTEIDPRNQFRLSSKSTQQSRDSLAATSSDQGSYTLVRLLAVYGLFNKHAYIRKSVNTELLTV